MAPNVVGKHHTRMSKRDEYANTRRKALIATCEVAVAILTLYTAVLKLRSETVTPSTSVDTNTRAEYCLLEPTATRIPSNEHGTGISYYNGGIRISLYASERQSECPKYIYRTYGFRIRIDGVDAGVTVPYTHFVNRTGALEAHIPIWKVLANYDARSTTPQTKSAVRNCLARGGNLWCDTYIAVCELDGDGNVIVQRLCDSYKEVTEVVIKGKRIMWPSRTLEELREYYGMSCAFPPQDVGSLSRQMESEKATLVRTEPN